MNTTINAKIRKKRVILMILFTYLLISVVSPKPLAGQSATTDELIHNPLLYGYVYWENGLPIYTSRRPQSWHNLDAHAEPDVVIQTGYYNLRFDADDIQFTGYDASNGSDYLTALHEDVTTFSMANLLLRVYKGDVAYTATGGAIDTDDLHVRLIESGQYVQRIDHTGIEFTDSNGNILDETGYFEITAWPDRVVFTLDFSESTDITRSTILVTSPDGENHLKDRLTNKLHLALQPQTHTRLEPLNSAMYVTDAYEKETTDPVSVTFDEDEYAVRLDLEPGRVAYPEDRGRVDEYVFTVNNPTDQPTNIPLVFNQIPPRTITGTAMNLVEDADGRPTGIPVQISKNWHRTVDQPTKHEGSWLRGSSMVTLPANSSKTLRLQVVYGYWDEVGAVSHSQLSLIGYGGNWKWDESALGAWGESMTFDPTQHIGAAFMDDIRPTWTPPMNDNSTTHNWTENVGGGDFLKYFDEDGNYRWMKKIKTAYRWTGPNITEVLYSGISDDDKVRFTYTTQFFRTNDYNRRTQKYRYEILEDINNPTRFVYYQMAADFYMVGAFTDYYIGNGLGEVSKTTPVHGGNSYASDPIPFNHSWIAIDDQTTTTGDTNGTRAILWQNSTLNSVPQELFIHPYGRTWGSSTTLFDFSGNNVTDSYSAGDVIEGELLFALPANSAEVYWGHDDEFAQRLTTYSDPWSVVYDEYTHNIEMNASASEGEILTQYPLVIDATSTTNVHVEVIIPANQGIGHIPVILQNAPANRSLKAQVYVNGAWEWAVNDEANNLLDNAYYQGYVNENGTMDYAFNIIRPSGTLQEEMPIRIFDEEPIESSVTVNCDSAWTLIDVILIKRHNVFLTESTDDCAQINGNQYIYLSECDVNQDNRCTLLDAVIIQQCNAFITNAYCDTLE